MRQKLSTHKAEPKCCHKLLSFPHHSAPSPKPANKVCYFSSLHPHPIDKHAAWYLFCTSSSGLITIMTRQPPVHLQISLLLQLLASRGYCLPCTGTGWHVSAPAHPLQQFNMQDVEHCALGHEQYHLLPTPQLLAVGSTAGEVSGLCSLQVEERRKAATSKPGASLVFWSYVYMRDVLDTFPSSTVSLEFAVNSWQSTHQVYRRGFTVIVKLPRRCCYIYRLKFFSVQKQGTALKGTLLFLNF